MVAILGCQEFFLFTNSKALGLESICRTKFKKKKTNKQTKTTTTTTTTNQNKTKQNKTNKQTNKTKQNKTKQKKNFDPLSMPVGEVNNSSIYLPISSIVSIIYSVDKLPYKVKRDPSQRTNMNRLCGKMIFECNSATLKITFATTLSEMTHF